ncbi:MAG TPA: RbsD/FucU domain-containing protein [Xanthobacteraceae bacterium]|nr:RbsD/FucU domain-containing protein [Xanthobacteraceae bacterium]
MLKGIDPLLGPELLGLLRAMGHGDEIAIVDANYPAQAHARRLVRMDGHSAPTILDAVLSVMPLDADVPEAAFRPCAFGDCGRLEPVFADFEAAIARHEPGFRLIPIAGPPFYERVRAAYALVASGERRLYGNIILRKGVIAPGEHAS